MENIKTDIKTIADWFLHYNPMTHKKLQKLLYFSYGLYLYENNESEKVLKNKLFENNFQAWVHGPVDPSIYNLYKNNGINLLCLEKPTKLIVDEEILKVLNKTIDKYGDYSADELEEITHNQLPWINARKGLSSMDICTNPIKDEDIYYAFKTENSN